MTEAELTSLLRGFRRRMMGARVARWALLVSLLVAFAAAGPLGTTDTSRVAMASLAFVLVGWLLLVTASVRTARSAQTGAALVQAGYWPEAEQELSHALRSPSVFRGVLLTAAQQLGVLLHCRREHGRAITVFRTLLEYGAGRPGPLPHFHTTVRLMLADCELALGNVQGAYEAFAPVFQTSLTLNERLMLLPIELRYELATGHTAHAVANLADKVRHAELLESPQAARVHALLADACRREGLAAQADFLERRARLYHDLDDEAAATVPAILPFSGAGL